MPLFVCDICSSIENTGAGSYWDRNITGLWLDSTLHGKALCSACMPGTYANGKMNKRGGKWHGRFDRIKATESEILREGISRFEYLGKFSYLRQNGSSK